MVEFNTSVEYNLDENSDSDRYNNKDIRHKESIVPGLESDSSDIEVSSVGSKDFSSDHTDFRDELDDNRPNTVNDVTVTANANIFNWTANFTNTTTEPFTQDSGPCLPKNFDVSVATALDYFNLFKPEYFVI